MDDPKSFCQVCERPGAHIHYHARVCNGCRVFFFRAVSDEQKLYCEKENNCEISYMKKRTNCSACRLKKCYEVKMQNKDVGKRRRNNGPVPYFTKFEHDSRINQYFGNLINHSPKIIFNHQYFYTTTSFFNYITRHIELSNSSLSTSFNDVILFPGTCLAKTAGGFENKESHTQLAGICYKLPESMARTFFAYMELMQCTPEYVLLPSQEQSSLYQQSGCLIILSLIRVEKLISRAEGSAFHHPRNQLQAMGIRDNFWKKHETVVNTGLQDEIEEMLLKTKVTPSELALLRLILMFHNIPNFSENSQRCLIQARIRLIRMLGDYIRESYPLMEKGDVFMRLQNFLHIEKLLMEVINTTNPIFTVLHHSHSKSSTPQSLDLNAGLLIL